MLLGLLLYSTTESVTFPMISNLMLALAGVFVASPILINICVQYILTTRKKVSLWYELIYIKCFVEISGLNSRYLSSPHKCEVVRMAGIGKAPNMASHAGISLLRK